MFTSPSSRPLRTALMALLVVIAVVGAACSGSDASSDGLPDLEDVPGAEAGSGGGDTAPDFTVMTLDSAGFTLSEHLADDGRPVFLNMWASWCPPCRAEMPDIDSASASHEGVKFIGVAANDDPVEATEFATSIDIGYTIGFDEHGTVARAYEVVGLPASYIISSDGIILERIFGSVTEAEIDEILNRWFS
ncbi:MAG: TlpA disulfide reductase family protein [Actinomycetota bacterium]|nr:TlpA disulfide reductase family protein [Actinomycetota bacterium]